MSFFTRMFTPSKSDNQSGEQYNQAQQQAALPPAPTPENAANTAAAEIERKRKMRLLAGGQTILAGSKPTLGNSGSTGSAKTLLGN